MSDQLYRAIPNFGGVPGPTGQRVFDVFGMSVMSAEVSAMPYAGIGVVPVDENGRSYFWNGVVYVTNAFTNQRVVPPTGFNLTPAFNVFRGNDGSFATDYDWNAGFVPADDTATWFVNPSTGVDGTAVLGNRNLPLLNLATAMAKTTGTFVEIIGITGKFIGRTTKSWNNVQTTQSFALINRTGQRYISAAVASAAIPTWAQDGTYPALYFATFSAANSNAVTDVSIERVPMYINPYSSRPVFLTDAPTAFMTYNEVADKPTAQATPGSWFNDGATTWVHPYDERNIIGDGTILVTNNTNNGRFPSVNNVNILLQDIDFVGGRPWYSLCASGVTGTVLKHKHCTFQGSGKTFNGLNIAAFQTVHGYKSGFYFNNSDGGNYHSNESDGTTLGTSPTFYEFGCVGWGNGTTGSANTSDNADTCHDDCRGVRVGCTYIDSDDRVVADTNFAQTWNLGCVIGQARSVAAGKESFAALASAKVWLDSCIFLPGANPLRIAAQSATMKLFNSGALTNAGTGEATGTIAAYPA